MQLIEITILNRDITRVNKYLDSEKQIKPGDTFKAYDAFHLSMGWMCFLFDMPSGAVATCYIGPGEYKTLPPKMRYQQEREIIQDAG